MVHNLIDTVEGILLVEDSVQEDAERPDVLSRAGVGVTGEDFGSSIIYSSN